jgi:hypothetical protein
MPSELGECFEALVEEGLVVAERLGFQWRSQEGAEFMKLLHNAQRILKEVKDDLSTRGANG